MEEFVEEIPAKPSVKHNLNFVQKLRFIFSNITVEPMLVCFVLPNIMASLTTQNLNLEKACRVNLKLDNEICNALSIRNSSGYNQSDEIAVQRLVASAYVWKNVVQSIFPVILLPFIGSWSDRYKRRKTCIFLPMTGEIFTNIGFLLCTYFFYQLPMEVNVATEVLPLALTGGWNVMFLGTFTYVCAMSSVETRTLRIGVVHVLFNISLTVGNALSGVLYQIMGFYGVFSLALGIYTVGILYGIIFVKEDRRGRQKRKKGVNFLRDFFDFKHITNTFEVVFKNGEGNRKKKVYLIMFLAMMIIGPIYGEMNVLYLYTRYKFHWNELDFSIFFTYSCIAHLLGCTFALAFFSKFLKLDDALLGLISSVSKICGCLVYAFAPTSLVFYIGTLVEVFNGTAFIAMRSIISKLVSGDELGKMNSIFGMSEALMPLVYGPMYSALYKATITIFPGSFYLLGSFLTIPAVIIFIWLYQNRITKIPSTNENEEKQEELLTTESRLLEEKTVIT
ncbi:hypothetical protein ILUMI_21937 [Ignelater luminosus]|uniref:Proton-coupled folate transporter n=1 Tax=Ignelater luminosus TaxID=2038154 RepID=A0A8K0CI19_IGNLU|nr:hypothetical protein ILUMI_21937 [Ignelater luminosus]